jgi:O-antigen/teichoic acid export membrane protein
MSEIVNSSLKSTVKGTSVVFLGMVASILLWFVTKVLIIRNTSKEELGIYSLVVAVVGIASSVATLGLQDGVPRYISIFQGEGRNDHARAISGTALRIGAVSGSVFFALLFFFSDPVARYVFYKPEISYSLKVVSFFIPASVMASIMIGILRGYNAMKPKVLIADIGQPLIFLAFLCIALVLRLSFISIIYAYSAAMVVIFFSFWIYGRKRMGLSLMSTGDSDGGKELIKFSVPLLVVSIMGLVLLWTDTLMLGRYAGESDVGLYSVSVSLARLLFFPLGALEFAFMAIAGGMYARKEHSALKKIYQMLTKWIFSATLPIFFILFFFPEMTITFLFGNRFTEAAMPLRILSAGFLFHAFLGANGVLMMVLGKAKELLHISVFGALLNILFNYILIKQLGYGIIGSSIATALSYFVINILISAALYRSSGIHPITPYYVKPALGSLVIGAVVYVTAKVLYLRFWMLPLYLALYLTGYFVFLIVVRSFEREDIEMLDTISRSMGVEMKIIRRLMRTSMR